MATRMARSARIAWVNQMEGNARPGGFVGDELAQLKEGPGMAQRSLLMTNRNPFSYARQVFESECLARVFGFAYHCLADTVIHIPLKTRLFARVLSEAAFGVLRSHLLQRLPPLQIAGTYLRDLRAAEGLAVTIRGQRYYAQVYAQCAFGVTGFAAFSALGDMQEVDTTPPHQISATDLPGGVNEHAVLAFSQYQAADNTACQRVQRDPIQAHEAVGTRIIADTAARAKLGTRLTLLGLHRLDRLNGFRPGAHCQLGAQAKAGTGLAVHPMVGRVRVGDMLFPTDRRDPGRRRVTGALGCGQDGFMAVYVKPDADGTSEGCVHVDVF